MHTTFIRQATVKDAESIREVLIESQWFTYRNLYTNEYIQKMIDDYYNLQRIKEEVSFITTNWHGYYIAEKQNKVVGVIGGGMIGDNASEIYVFYLDPSMRGKGIGTRLLNFFTKIQKHSYGALEQWVAVARGNIYGIPFYEARGFIFRYEEPTYGTTEADQDVSLKFKRDI